MYVCFILPACLPAGKGPGVSLSLLLSDGCLSTKQAIQNNKSKSKHADNRPNAIRSLLIIRKTRHPIPAQPSQWGPQCTRALLKCSPILLLPPPGEKDKRSEKRSRNEGEGKKGRLDMVECNRKPAIASINSQANSLPIFRFPSLFWARNN